MSITWLLVFLFVLKHFAGDYLMQLHGESANKRLPGWKGAVGVAHHAQWHGAFTFFVILIVGCCFPGQIHTTPWVGWIPLLDFGTHFAIDLGKVKAEEAIKQRLWQTYQSRDRMTIYLKVLTGVDQLAHFCVYTFMVYMLSYS